MRIGLLFILFIPITMVSASDLASDRPLTLEQAIIQVLEKNPLLKATDLEAQAAAARIRAAQLSPAFRASVALENFAGNGTNKGDDNLETTLSLTKVLELGNKADARTRFTRQQAMLLGNHQDAQRLDLLAQSTKRFIYVIGQQERLKLMRDSLLLAQRTKKIILRRVRAGRSPNTELGRTNISLQRKKLDLKRVEYALEVSRLNLSSLWSETIPRFHYAAGDLYKTSPLPPLNVLVEGLAQNPDLMALLSQQRLADMRVELAQSKRSMDVEIAAGIRHFNATDDSAFMLSLNLPLGTSSRAQVSIDEARSLQQREPYLYQQKLLLLHTLLSELHKNIRYSIELITSLREQIIPQAQLTLKDYERGYTAGRYSYLELTEAQGVLLGARLEAIIAATDYHRYRIDMDRLTGAGLSTGVNP